MSAAATNLDELTRARDMIFVLRPDGTNPDAVRQFARVLKHALRIHGLACVDMRLVRLEPIAPAAAPDVPPPAAPADETDRRPARADVPR